MAHISSIGAGMFSDLSIAMDGVGDTLPTTFAQADFDTLFGTVVESVGGTAAAGKFVRVKNVREFPPMGNPPNIVNVPTFGQKSSQQIQGQSDAPNIEITMNYVASEWASGTLLGNAVGDGKVYTFRFALLNSEPTLTTSAQYASTLAGIGSVANTYWYWTGKVEALLVTPSLSDANQATVTMTIQSKLYGAYTAIA